MPAGMSTTGFGPTTIVVTMPANQKSSSDAALIAGVVGGAIPLIIVIGLIGCVVVRKRRSKNKSCEPSPNQEDSPTAPSSTTPNYGYISLGTTQNGYEVGNINIAPEV